MPMVGKDTMMGTSRTPNVYNVMGQVLRSEIMLTWDQEDDAFNDISVTYVPCAGWTCHLAVHDQWSRFKAGNWAAAIQTFAACWDLAAQVCWLPSAQHGLKNTRSRLSVASAAMHEHSLTQPSVNSLSTFLRLSMCKKLNTFHAIWRHHDEADRMLLAAPVGRRYGGICQTNAGESGGRRWAVQ